MSGPDKQSTEWVKHDSFDPDYREPAGALKIGESLLLRFYCRPEDGQTPQVYLVVTDDRTKENKVHLMNPIGDLGWVEVGLTMPKNPTLIFYHFKIELKDQTFYYGQKTPLLAGTGHLSPNKPSDYQVTVYEETREMPAWYTGGVVYQIYVDRFQRELDPKLCEARRPDQLMHLGWDDDPFYIRDPKTSAITHWDFFGGNLAGVIERLPYLNSLGVTCLYLNPIFEARSNHKYDTGDYHRVDPMYGDSKIFKELCQKARTLGIRLILDGVFSHTGSDSIYFNKEGYYPSLGAYQSGESIYRSWYRFTDGPEEYESWWGVSDLPNVNELDKDYLEYIIHGHAAVVPYWMGLGASGWRLDVADELPEAFIGQFKKKMLEIDEEAILVGEVWEDASNKVSYGQRRTYLLGRALDGTMHYPFQEVALAWLRGEEKASLSLARLMTLEAHYPPSHQKNNLNILGTHDTRRILSSLNEDRELLHLAIIWQCALPGVVHVYYGDEAGLLGETDPDNRKTFPWETMDLEIQGWYRELLAIHRLYPVFTHGRIQALESPEDLLYYRLDSADQEAWVLVNRGHKTHQVTLKTDKALRMVYPLNKDQLGTPGDIAVEVAPQSGLVFVSNHDLRLEMEKRQAGILMPLASLAGDDGIGNIGKASRDFVKYLASADQSVWQILPFHPVDGLGSPYQSSSSFAGNHLLIDLGDLVDLGLIDASELKVAHSRQVDYAEARSYKEDLLKKAYMRFSSHQADFSSLRDDFELFCQKEAYWLSDYALFMVLKEDYHPFAWNGWPEGLRQRDDDALAKAKAKKKKAMAEVSFGQFIFFKQFDRLRQTLATHKIRLFGDMPLYVGWDSADVWANQSLFCLDAGGEPTQVGGVPPDAYSASGQRWGNPLYDWEAMQEDGYSWWIARLKYLQSRVDMVRIDHFRGLADYWEIPASEATAIHGRWRKGPGRRILVAWEKAVENLSLVAEDLGILSEAAARLVVQSGYPGMAVIQHMLDGPEQGLQLGLGERKKILYPGTHDDTTLLAWLKEGLPSLGPQELEAERLRVLEDLYGSVAELVMVTYQDILGLGAEARTNTPGTSQGNWSWQATQEMFNEDVRDYLKGISHRYHRQP